ncbi:MAG: peptidylprolyl isomerase [Candidatus Goldiibacteriota bacterium]
MRKFILIFLCAAVFAAAGCGTTGGGHDPELSYNEEGGDPGSMEKLQKLKEENEKKAEQEDASREKKDEELSKNVMAKIGDFTLDQERYRIIREYMQERHGTKLTEAQETELLEYIFNKKLMALEAERQGYNKKKELRYRYEWDYDEILSHAYYNENVEEKSKVTDAEAKEYYNKNKEDFIEIKAQHILVKNSALARNIYKSLLAGRDFENAAEKYSEDSTTRTKGGDVGYFTKGVMVKEFEDTAFSLGVDEISEPVQTVYGYHIIRINDKKEISFSDSKDRIIKIIENKKKKEIFEDVIERLRKKYDVNINENYLRR